MTQGTCQASGLKLALTPREAAKALGISVKTLYNYTVAGRIKAIRLSPQTKRYTPEALLAFLDQAGRES
jgi:excisionase family DNA binding protein